MDFAGSQYSWASVQTPTKSGVRKKRQSPPPPPAPTDSLVFGQGRLPAKNDRRFDNGEIDFLLGDARGPGNGGGTVGLS